MAARTRWVVLGGSFIAYMFDALEIILLSLALPAIRNDMHLTPLQGGLLATATLLGIGLSSVLAGYLADNFGRKKALIASLVSVFILTSIMVTGNGLTVVYTVLNTAMVAVFGN